jgi:phosphoenolpyruvate carboxylase
MARFRTGPATPSCDAPVVADPFDALRRDISDLGHILGDTLVEQEGKPLLELEEAIRALAKLRRKRDRRGPSATSMREIIEKLDGPTAERVARAFTHYFQLVNLAEQHHRARRRRDYAREKQPQPGSLAFELRRLAEKSSRADLDALLARASIELVFTAHPSEAQRRTVLDKHRRIAQVLTRRDRSELVPEERDALDEALREEVTTLWQTDEIRMEKPRVGDEVKNTLFYLEEVLFPLVPIFHEAFEREATAAFGDGMRIPSSILRFGSWVGADMDGNPNVTPDVALDTAFAQSARLAGRYLDALDALGQALSQSTRRVTASAALMSSLEADALSMPAFAAGLEASTQGEPYRKKLRFARARLEATRQALLDGRIAGASKLDLPLHAYAEPAALLADLALMARSLEENRGSRAGLRRVRALERQVETFGFHLAKLDVRVPAAWVRDAARRSLWVEGEAPLDAAVLERALVSEHTPPRADAAGMRAMEAVARIRAVTANGGAESFILSMARGHEDMLATLVLARIAGLYRPKDGVADVSVVPLFETLDDLERCPAEVERAATQPAYRRYLELRGGVQEIMIGYSDSNKDAGILMSSFALYRAQQQLVDVGKRNGLHLKIFHGRGGSIGRGGGPSQRAIESLPHGSIDGRFKLTEQGEVLGWKYLLAEIAERNLEITASGVLRASLDRGVDHSAFEEAFAGVAQTSLEAYRSLVHDPDFVEYYEQSTPLAEIALLNIGSRPARRSNNAKRTLDDLRAIPWVFAWTQSRQMVPGWFGAGRALCRLIDERGLAFARRMNAEWPFFASTLDAVAVSLATADMDIARRYASLVDDEKVARRLFFRIALDHGRAERAVMQILDRPSVLAPASTLARSIELRNPYVDPLSFIQLDLLRRKRALVAQGLEVPHELDRALLLTINGIAAGLRNTG